MSDEVNEKAIDSGTESGQPAELPAQELDKVAGGAVSTVSNIMKTKHDTVKNSISNIR